MGLRSRRRLAFCKCPRRYYLGNPPIFKAMVFGIRLSIGTVGEQADNLEATARAYQDCHEHCKLPHEQHAALPASAAVTAVTGYSSNSPLFFGRPICASRSRLGLSWS